MKIYILIASTIFLLGCGKADNPAGSTSAPSANNTFASSATGANESDGKANAKSGIEGRQGELASPNDSSIVFLYYSLASLKPPLESWVENDPRLLQASAPDKALRRQELHNEYELGAKSVNDIGTIRVSLNSANVSEYDPTYGEFTVGAISPGSHLAYSAFNQNIKIQFANAKTAQLWRVTPEEAQVVRDKLGRYASASVDLELKIIGVQPETNGGTIMANIVEYELRDNIKNIAVGRIKPEIKP
jgi:hypothetical protein